MEKEKILSMLTEKIGKTSLSERTISDYVNNNLPAEGTEPDDAYFKRHTAILVSLNGQLSHDVAAAVEEAKKNFKLETDPIEKHEEKEEKPEKNRDLEELKEKLIQLESKLTEGEKAKAKAELQEKLSKEMKAKGANDSYVLKNTLKALELDSENDFETVLESALKAYDAEFRECRGDGAVPRTAGGNQSKENNALLQRLKEKHIADGKLPENK